MAKIKQKCELCGAVFGMVHDECPKCGCPEIYEVRVGAEGELIDEEGDISPYEFFDSPCNPVDTVGGI